MSKKYFTFRPIDNSPLSRCIICPADYDAFPLKTKTGSYAVAPARVLGLDYPTYLRFIRDSFPEAVTLEGKDGLYVRALWKRGSRELLSFIDLLNIKLELAVLEAEENA
jgi:hypothetical protein